MFTRHYNFNDVTKKRQRHIIIARDVRPPKPPLGMLSCQISWDLFSVEKFQAILELQTAFTTSIIPSKYVGSIKFDVKRIEKKLFSFRVCRRIGINLIIAILRHKRNRKFDYFSVRSVFISLMNTESNIISLVAPPLVKILLLVFIRWNKNRFYTKKVKYPVFHTIHVSKKKCSWVNNIK